jgi:hypothetical protein
VKHFFFATMPVLTIVSACNTFVQTTPISTQQGQFVSGEHPTKGSVKLYSKGKEIFLEFNEEFSTDAGPDLFVILHRQPNLIAATQPPVHAINSGDYAVIAPLQNIKGKQVYSVPLNVNLAEYQSVAVWCQQFNATFGSATLVRE